MTSDLSLRALFGTTGSVIAQQPWFFTATTAVGAAPGLIAVVVNPNGDGYALILLSTLLGLYLQLLATFRTIELLGAMPADYQRAHATEKRFPAAFLGSLLTTLTILAGLAALVVPGLLLLALWSLWLPALAAERLGVLGAMRRSWRLVRPRIGSVLILALLAAGAFVTLVVACVAGYFLLAEGQWWIADVLFELLFTAGLIASAVLWAVTYVQLLDEA